MRKYGDIEQRGIVQRTLGIFSRLPQNLFLYLN